MTISRIIQIVFIMQIVSTSETIEKKFNNKIYGVCIIGRESIIIKYLIVHAYSSIEKMYSFMHARYL